MTNEIKTFTLEQLKSVAKELGQPEYRANQLFQWLNTHHASSYDEMTNLPKSFRDSLTQKYPLRSLQLVDKQVSKDGTSKYILKLSDGKLIETVAIPSSAEVDGSQRLTVCVSTQVGCPMKCAFCATGMEGFKRNLTSDEIVDQVVFSQKERSQRVSNIVVMGQGEPFLNYDATLQALRALNSSDNLNIGARKITISTSGILNGIEKLSREPEQFTLAISLHSANQTVRDGLMPKVSNQPLSLLKEALMTYSSRTKRRVTLEYLLIRDINDSENDLQDLLEFCKGLFCHINILPMNQIPRSPYGPSSSKTVQWWLNSLNNAGIEATLRHSRGQDIAGACGQLKNSFQF